MRSRSDRRQCRTWLLLSLALAAGPCLGAIETALADRYAQDRMNCRSPIALSRDCSDRNGPTRPIALDGFRMNMAGSRDGRTVLINQVRYAPDHNGRQFRPDEDHHTIAIAAIRTMRRWLRDRGACLEHWEPLRHAGRARGYLLTFSDDVYAELRRLTLLESEHWLPQRLTRR